MIKRVRMTGLALIACMAFLAVPVAALASSTVTLEAEVNDNFQLVGGDGRIYDVADTEKGNELVDKHVGDKVKVTGTVEQDEEQNLILVTAYVVMAE